MLTMVSPIGKIMYGLFFSFSHNSEFSDVFRLNIFFSYAPYYLKNPLHLLNSVCTNNCFINMICDFLNVIFSQGQEDLPEEALCFTLVLE